jgi:hypothetical protein
VTKLFISVKIESVSKKNTKTILNLFYFQLSSCWWWVFRLECLFSNLWWWYPNTNMWQPSSHRRWLILCWWFCTRLQLRRMLGWLQIFYIYFIYEFKYSANFNYIFSEFLEHLSYNVLKLSVSIFFFFFFFDQFFFWRKLFFSQQQDFRLFVSI